VPLAQTPFSYGVNDQNSFEVGTRSVADRLPSEKTGLDRLEGFLDKTEGALGKYKNSLGFLGGLAGAGVSAWDAMAKNKLMAKDRKRMMAERAAQQARAMAYDAPIYSTNTRTANPTWGAGNAAFSNNSLAGIKPMAEGGSTGGYARGGSARYVEGGTSGQADQVPAMLSDGEFVFDADSVAALGDGNNAAGASALEQMRRNIRKHKRSAPANKIPPKAKKPEQYLKKGK
jgi:hypothetical protein